MEGVSFVKLEEGDKSTIFEMIKGLYAEDPDGAMSDEQVRKTLEFLPMHPDYGTIMVFKFNSQVIGYSILINFYSNEYGGIILNVDELFVAPEFRGRGIATQFVKYLKETNFMNYVALELEVLPYNVKALKLYERIGFVKSSRSYLMLKKSQE